MVQHLRFLDVRCAQCGRVYLRWHAVSLGLAGWQVFISLIAGILIYDVLKYLIPVWSAILITLIILVTKEVVLDKWIRKGVADWHDIIWGVIGLLLGVL